MAWLQARSVEEGALVGTTAFHWLDSSKRYDVAPG